MKNTIAVHDLKSRSTDRFENRSIDCCLQALRNLGYEVREAAHFLRHRRMEICYGAWKDGFLHYTVRVECN
jgi:hypothetical protein